VKKFGGICVAIGLLLGVLVLGAPAPASAATGDGCGFDTVNDSTGLLGGGPTTWHGVIYLSYVPPAGKSATASCEIYVNGVSQGIKLGPITGTGVVAGAGRLTFTADDNDVVRLCMHVRVGTVTQPDICFEGPGPDPLEPVYALVDTAWNAVNGVAMLLDPTLCSALVRVAPTVNVLPPSVLRIDPTYGDVYVFGEPMWDCPPYATA
jgi:hypothetical protein